MLSKLLTSDTRAQVFRLLFDGEAREYYLREIEKLSGKTIRTIQQEVKHLEALDLISSRKDGNRVYFKANRDHPLYVDLVSIVEKTVGLVSQIKARLMDSRVDCAFLFGSLAKGKDKAVSDIDLIVIGSLGMRTLSKLLSGLEEKLGREINPHVFTTAEFKKRINNHDRFISSVLDEQVKIIVGNLDDYR